MKTVNVVLPYGWLENQARENENAGDKALRLTSHAAIARQIAYGGFNAQFLPVCNGTLAKESQTLALASMLREVNELADKVKIGDKVQFTLAFHDKPVKAIVGGRGRVKASIVALGIREVKPANYGTLPCLPWLAQFDELTANMPPAKGAYASMGDMAAKAIAQGLAGENELAGMGLPSRHAAQVLANHLALCKLAALDPVATLPRPTNAARALVALCGENDGAFLTWVFTQAPRQSKPAKASENGPWLAGLRVKYGAWLESQKPQSPSPESQSPSPESQKPQSPSPESPSPEKPEPASQTK
jgi:hypothetical protein